MTAAPPPLAPAQAGAHPSTAPTDSTLEHDPALRASPDSRGMGPGVRRGERKERSYAPLAYGLAALVIVLDQLSKVWVLDVLRLPFKGQIPVWPPIFNLTFVWNRGVSFGLLRAQADLARWGLVLFSALVVIALAVWARRAERRLAAVWMGLIMGGAIGNNLIDRVRFGAVVDFLDFGGLHFPWVFNVADSAITIGVAVMLLDSLRTPSKAA